MILLLILEFILISSDMMRWQPPIFQFYAIVLIYTIKPKYFKYYLIVLLSATYFYSGLNKINLRFINFIWAKSILIDLFGFSSDFAFSKLVKALGFILPIIELFAGLLILSKYRKIGFFTVIGIHVFILLYISPLGLNINSAVWSWNIIMIFYALAFLKQNTIDKPKFKIVEKSWVVLLYVLPILNLFEYYYPYFAFDLYSGSRYYLYVKTTSPDETDVSTLNIDNWSRKNLNVPFTHSHFLFKRFIKSYSKTYPNSNALFEISCYPFKTREKYSG
ncbi:hypothetical protein [Flavobacteriaceae bacterium 14752]|uniref:hypothetical protein n=1 Tax=Mesohalobacter salilacus TaxID=2491711 RepID=UPI000F63A60D|nr:hypothetical protein EIG84_00005 [Flavobacteriaceae bacterium 14752]